MRSSCLIAAVCACYTPSPPLGAPCDPASDLCPTGQACIASPTGFACLPEGTPPAVDAPLVDSGQVVTPCPPDPDLLLCYSFDGALASPLANEGRAGVVADLVNVSSTPNGAGRAALLGISSSIAVRPNTVLVGILALEASIRLDARVPDAGRIGLLDADKTAPGTSMFLFAATGGGTQLRCTVGDANLFVDLPIQLGSWIRLACTCEAGKVVAYADGARLGELDGCLASAADISGLQIGANSRVGDGLPPNEPLIGAIDDVRLWTVVPPL